MALNDIYRASFVFDAPDANPDGMVYTIHYRTSLVNTPVDPVAEGGELTGELRMRTEALYLPLIPNVISLREVTVIGITEPTVGITDPSGVVGGDTDNALPFRNAFHTTNKTGLRGRRLNGRTNLMTCGEAQTSGGVILASYQTSVLAYMLDISSPVGSATTNEWSMVIWSRVNQDSVDVTQIITQDNFATIRARQTA